MQRIKHHRDGKSLSCRFCSFGSDNELGTKDFIPEAVGDAEAVFVVFVMMVHVVGFEMLHGGWESITVSADSIEDHQKWG